MKKSITVVALALFALTITSFAKGPTYTDPKKADADFPIQGEYTGSVKADEGEVRIGVQVIALGKGTFQAVAYLGGLPGDGYNGDEVYRSDGVRKGDKVAFTGEHANAEIIDGLMVITDVNGNKLGALKKVMRKSPTLGKKPPQGAVVLFDGTSADAFADGRMSDDGLLLQGTHSNQDFGDHHLHIEFCLPYQPENRGQGRGNSGIYLQGRYEVQMLDSFGLEGKNNECGGIYERRDPDVNMCFPPLSWQTYDIDFTAAKYDDQGKLVAKPRLTVRHNGHVVHNNFELPNDKPTRAAPVKAGPEPGPVYVQDHGNPVRYRNIWVAKK